MTNSPEQLDEFIRRMQNHADVSDLSKDPANAGSVNIVSLLNNIPKANIPKANLLRVRSKILDKISLPTDLDSDTALFGISLLRGLPRFLKITGGIVGAFTIVLSLTIGTAVAALESVPGQTIYPIKRMVESVQLKLAGSEEQKANLQIKFANTRVDEMEAILQKQKEGKVSDEEVQKVVADTVRNIQITSETVAAQSKDDPQLTLLNKIVTLSDKQTAVIAAAQVEQDGLVQEGLDLALEVSKTTKEQAIENIEKAGLVIEDEPLDVDGNEIKDENGFSAEGKITQSGHDYLNIGSARFLLTDATEYVNIKSDDLKIGLHVTITGQIKDEETYVTKIVADPQPEETPEPEDDETDNESEQEPDSETTEPQTVPVDPQN